MRKLHNTNYKTAKGIRQYFLSYNLVLCKIRACLPPKPPRFARSRATAALRARRPGTGSLPPPGRYAPPPGADSLTLRVVADLVNEENCARLLRKGRPPVLPFFERLRVKKY